MILRVRVKPGSSQERVELEGETLVVWLTSRPVEGNANKELLKLLKKTFGDAKLVRGAKSRAKMVEIPQQTVEQVRNLLAHL